MAHCETSLSILICHRDRLRRELLMRYVLKLNNLSNHFLYFRNFKRSFKKQSSVTWLRGKVAGRHKMIGMMCFRVARSRESQWLV